MNGYDGKETAFRHNSDAFPTFTGPSSTSVINSQPLTLTFDGHDPGCSDDTAFIFASKLWPTFDTMFSSSNPLREEELLGHDSEDSAPLKESHRTDMPPFCDLMNDGLLVNLNCGCRV